MSQNEEELTGVGGGGMKAGERDKGKDNLVSGLDTSVGDSAIA